MNNTFQRTMIYLDEFRLTVMSVGWLNRHFRLAIILLLVPFGNTEARSPFDKTPPPPAPETKKRSPFDSPKQSPSPISSPSQEPRQPFPPPVSQPPSQRPVKPNTPFDQNSVKPTQPPFTTQYLPQNFQKWFPNIQRRPVEFGNDISILVGIPEIKNGISEALKTIKGPSHYVYMCQWKVDGGVKIPDGGSSLVTRLKEVSDKGAQVRALIFGPDLASLSNRELVWWTNKDFVQSVNSLDNGLACLDDKMLLWGTHHQKIFIVRGSQGLIAFCGSYDPETTREGFNKDYLQPWHEVTLRIQGPTAYRLLQIFLERWEDSKAVKKIQKDFETLRGRAIVTEIGKSDTTERPSNNGMVPAQVTATSGDLTNNRIRHNQNIVKEHAYRFAPTGERSFREALAHAIDEAKREIYLECQYGWGETIGPNESLRTKLANAVKRGVSVTVVTPHQDSVDEFGMADVLGFNIEVAVTSQRKGVLSGLLAGAGMIGVGAAKRIIDFKRAQDWFWWEPLGAQVLGPDGSHLQVFHTNAERSGVRAKRPMEHFVHSKVWVFDWEFALVGSGNFNNRSLSHDSEVMVGFYDPVKLRQVRTNLKLPSKESPPEYVKKYKIPHILYDNFKGVGDVVADAQFSKTVDRYGGPREGSQIITTVDASVDELDRKIRDAINADLGGKR